MHHAAAVGMPERVKQLTHQPHGLLGTEAKLGVEQVLQRLAAWHQLHHDVGQIGLVVVVVNLDDIGVLELGGRLRLGQKAPGIFLGIAGVDVVLADDLDGHEFAPQQAVPAFIDDTHRALAQRADDLILAKSFRVFGVHNQQDTASAAHKPTSRPPRLRGAGRRISQARGLDSMTSACRAGTCRRSRSTDVAARAPVDQNLSCAISFNGLDYFVALSVEQLPLALICAPAPQLIEHGNLPTSPSISSM